MFRLQRPKRSGVWASSAPDSRLLSLSGRRSVQQRPPHIRRGCSSRPRLADRRPVHPQSELGSHLVLPALQLLLDRGAARQRLRPPTGQRAQGHARDELSRGRPFQGRADHGRGDGRAAQVGSHPDAGHGSADPKQYSLSGPGSENLAPFTLANASLASWTSRCRTLPFTLTSGTNPLLSVHGGRSRGWTRLPAGRYAAVSVVAGDRWTLEIPAAGRCGVDCRAPSGASRDQSNRAGGGFQRPNQPA